MSDIRKINLIFDNNFVIYVYALVSTSNTRIRSGFNHIILQCRQSPINVIKGLQLLLSIINPNEMYDVLVVLQFNNVLGGHFYIIMTIIVHLVTDIVAMIIMILFYLESSQ